MTLPNAGFPPDTRNMHLSITFPGQKHIGKAGPPEAAFSAALQDGFPCNKKIVSKCSCV